MIEGTETKANFLKPNISTLTYIHRNSPKNPPQTTDFAHLALFHFMLQKKYIKNNERAEKTSIQKDKLLSISKRKDSFGKK